MSHRQSARQNHNKITNLSSENLANLRHLGTRVTDQNWIYEEIKIGLNSTNACYSSGENPVFSCLAYV
jgi:hypothetical protein